MSAAGKRGDVYEQKASIYGDCGSYVRGASADSVQQHGGLGKRRGSDGKQQTGRINPPEI